MFLSVNGTARSYGHRAGRTIAPPTLVIILSGFDVRPRPGKLVQANGAAYGRMAAGVEDNERLVVIASNYGQHRNPAWYHNLRDNPRASIVFEGVERDVVARELTGEEREHWYARGIEVYPGWTQYRKRASHRRIPVIELTSADG
jgi:deazaflavin-dependent oxidoreductase (nitroreductase family)